MRTVLAITTSFILLAIGLTFYAAIAFAQSNNTILRNVLPGTTNLYDLGTSTRTWANIWAGFNTSGATRCLQITSDGQFSIASAGCSSGGITSLNGLTGATQTFSDSDDTNVTLQITSAVADHQFALGWTGTLGVARGGTASGTPKNFLFGNGAGILTSTSSISKQFLDPKLATLDKSGTSTFDGGLTAAYFCMPNGNCFQSATSTANVSSISNSDGTLTISPTTGTVVASLNLGNANTWTVGQTFGSGFTINSESFTDLTGTGLQNTAGALNVIYGSSAGQAAQGNTTLTGATAGAGLTGGGGTIAVGAGGTFTGLDVGAGTGITVNANDVALTIPVAISSGGTGRIAFPASALIGTDPSGNLIGTSSIGVGSIYASSTSRDNYIAGTLVVGSSTTTPSNKLHIVHNDTHGGITLDRWNNVSAKSQISFRQNNTEWWALGIDPNSTGEWRFFVYNANDGTTPLQIATTSEVGIGGTTTPSATLGVQGNALISGTSTFAGIIAASSSVFKGGIVLPTTGLGATSSTTFLPRCVNESGVIAGCNLNAAGRLVAVNANGNGFGYANITGSEPIGTAYSAGSWNIIAATPFTVQYGGTGRNAVPVGALLIGNEQGIMQPTTTPTMDAFVATSSAKTSLFKNLSGDSAFTWGSASNFMTISSGGLLTFSGTGHYDTSCANPRAFGLAEAAVYGLDFNCTTGHYDFENAGGTPQVKLEAIAGTGSGFGGTTTPRATVAVAGDVLVSGTSTLAALNARNSLQVGAPGQGAVILRMLTASTTLNFGLVSQSSSAELTATVAGANTGDMCHVTPHESVITGGTNMNNLTFFCYVSSANTVTVRVINNDATNKPDPAAGAYRILVTSFAP